MVPWVLIYGLNILGLFTSSIICFYSLEGGFKALGLIPLLIGCFVLVGHFAVLYFLMDQRTDFMSGACNAIVSEASTPAWEKEEEEKKKTQFDQIIWNNLAFIFLSLIWLFCCLFIFWWIKECNRLLLHMISAFCQRSFWVWLVENIIQTISENKPKIKF